MNDEIEGQLADIISGKSRDLAWAKETYDEVLDDLQDRANGDVNEDALAEHAVRIVKRKANQSGRSSGEVEEVEVVVIGHGGGRTWSDDDGGEKEVLISYGVVNPKDDDKPRGLGVFINDETTGVDIQNLKDKFSTLNQLTAYYSLSNYDDLPNTYILDSTDQTKVEVADPEDMASEDARRGLLHEWTEEAELGNIKQHLSATDDQGRTLGFGADVKRMNATVVDQMETENTAIYTLLDDSVIDPEELDEDVRDDRAQTPGLTSWTPKELMKYGINSQIEVYGSVATMDDGQVCMNVYGIVPLITFELDDDGDSSSGVSFESETIQG